MTLLWTKRKGLDIITWALEEPVSHFGIMFFGTTVCHWSFIGFKIDTLADFTKSREIVLRRDIKLPAQVEDDIFVGMKRRWKHSLYDFAYVLWLTYRAVLLKFLRMGIPYKEPFGETTNNMICHEALEALPEEFRPKYDRDKSNTPNRLYIALTRGENDIS